MAEGPLRGILGGTEEESTPRGEAGPQAFAAAVAAGAVGQNPEVAAKAATFFEKTDGGAGNSAPHERPAERCTHLPFGHRQFAAGPVWRRGLGTSRYSPPFFSTGGKSASSAKTGISNEREQPDGQPVGDTSPCILQRARSNMRRLWGWGLRSRGCR